VNVSKPRLVKLLNEMCVCIYHALCHKLLAALILHNYYCIMHYFEMIHKQFELKTQTINSLPPQWCRYLYCCLTHSSCVEVTQIWGLVHVEKDSESAPSVHAIFGVYCAYRPYRPCWTASLNSQFLCCVCVCTFCVIFCGLKSQSHSDNGHVHATVLTLAPQCHAFL